MATTNRFLELRRLEPSYSERHARSRPRDWVVPQAAANRELIVLLENGGIDLGLRSLVDAVVNLLPGASLVVSDDLRGKIAASMRDWLKQTTDGLLESAELTLNRYSAAQPEMADTDAQRPTIAVARLAPAEDGRSVPGTVRAMLTQRSCDPL